MPSSKTEEEKLGIFVEWHETWDTTTVQSRAEAERDHDYYHGKQWTPEEIQELESRRQPIIVKNRIFKKINFLLGDEIANRTDPEALPRTEMHTLDAPAITDGLRYIADMERMDQVTSKV